ncbi:MAG: hypothetical protein M3082_13160 [Candidatus Dormibacteraeota bacterium]|jgi:Flp pilus assembly protein TadG|nr:hypothetical protein [Candidatus Dormibacteraeota bacterium]
MTSGTARAQALLELSLCAPVIVLLALGSAATVQVAGARAGLDAATQAAANAAVRAPDPAAALAAAQRRFSTVVADYPLRSPTLSVSMGGFSRSGKITVSSSAQVDLRWAAFLLVPNQLTLRSQVVLWLESWRTHTTSS